jgi:hypothetical protein
MRGRQFAIRAAAHSGREGFAERDVIYDIYARAREINRVISTAYP